MLDYGQVRAATRIGMLTRERDTEAASAEALSTLGEVLASDAAMLIARDPFSGTHFRLAGLSCSAEHVRSFTTEFVGTPWFHNVTSHRLPPSISGEADQSFRRSWFYEEHVRPAGFRDGMSGALRHRGRYVGMIHLSAERSGTFDEPARHLLASVLPALAALADATARVGYAAELPEGEPAALVTPDRIVDLPGRDWPPVLADEGFRCLVREFAALAGQRLRLLWPAGPDWYRVLLTRQSLACVGTTHAVLVQAAPTALPYHLSPRELEVLTRAAMGQTNQVIAQELFLSPRTVHTHIEHLLRKTGAASRAQATALAVRDGLLRPAPDMLACFVEPAVPSRSV